MIGKPEFIKDARVIWHCLCKNFNAVHILEQMVDMTEPFGLCFNKNINAFRLLEIHHLDILFSNEKLWRYAEGWNCLSANIHAINILEKNLDKVNWEVLSSNPNAIKIIENNLDKVKWYLKGKASIVDCEHRSFHLMAFNNGAKIRIAPEVIFS